MDGRVPGSGRVLAEPTRSPTARMVRGGDPPPNSGPDLKRPLSVVIVSDMAGPGAIRSRDAAVGTSTQFFSFLKHTPLPCFPLPPARRPRSAQEPFLKAQLSSCPLALQSWPLFPTSQDLVYWLPIKDLVIVYTLMSQRSRFIYPCIPAPQHRAKHKTD